MCTRFPCTGTVIASLELKRRNDVAPCKFLARIKSNNHIWLPLVVSTVYEISTMAGSEVIERIRWRENILEVVKKVVRNIQEGLISLGLMVESGSVGVKKRFGQI